LISYGENFTLRNLVLNNQQGLIAHQGTGVLSLDTLNALNNQQGEILGQGQINITADVLTNKLGLIQAEHGMALAANQLNNQQGNIVVFEQEALTLTVAEHINNQGGSIAAQTLNIESNTLDNGKVTGDINSNGGEILATTMQLGGGLIDNSDGVISGNNLTFNTDNLINNKGFIGANQSFSMTIAALLNNDQGQIITTAANAHINAVNLTNQQGVISQQNTETLTLQVANNLTNNLGEITSAQQLQLNVNNLDNTGTIDGQSVAISATNIDNRGTIQAEQTTINTNNLDNSGLLLASGTNGNTLSITTANGLTNSGVIQSNGEQLTFAQSVDNRQGTIVHTGSDTVSFTQLLNEQGTIYALADFTLSGNDLNNQNGVIQVRGNADLTLNNLNNLNGEISTHGQTTTIDVAQTLSNQGGVIIADNNQLTLQAHTLTNGNGTIAASNNLALIANTVNNNAGLIRSENQLNITSDNLNNNALISGANLIINSDEVNNQNGTIESFNSMSLTLANINNQNGSVLSGGNNFAMNVSGLLDNRLSGQIEVHGINGLIEAKNINNQGGVLHHTGNGQLHITSNQYLNNQNGVIASLGSVNVALNGEEGGQSLNNNQGIIQTTADLSLTSNHSINNSNGVLLSQGKVTIDGTHLNNTEGQIIANSGAEFTLSGDITNNNGLLHNQNGHFSVTANSLNNGSGVVQQQGLGALSLFLTSLNNNGDISGVENVNITANTIANTGVIQAKQLTTNGSQLANSGTLAAEVLTLNAASINNQSGVLYASATQGESLRINTTGEINNTHGVIQSKGNGLTLSQNVNNNQGEILLLSGGTLAVNGINNDQGKLLSLGNISAAGTVNNQNGQIEASNNLATNAATITNTNGSMFAGGSLNIQANSLANQGGIITNAGDLYSINSSVIDNRNGGVLASNATNMNISGNSLQNTNGTITHQGNGRLLFTNFNAINNNAGTLASNGLLEFAINSLTNDSVNGQQGIITANTAELTIDELSNRNSVIQANNVTINSNNVDNSDGLIRGLSHGNNSLALNVSGTLTNNNGELISQGALALTAGEFNNNSGTLSSQGDQQLTLTNLENSGGRIESATHLNAAFGGTVNNNSGVMVTGGELTLNASGNLTNRDGVIFSGENSNISAASVANTNGTLAANSNLTLNSNNELSNSGGVIQSDSTVTVTAGTLSNNAGLLQGQHVNLTSATALNNNSGTITGNLVTLKGTNLNNTNGTVLSTSSSNNTFNLSGLNSITNTNGTLATYAQNLSLLLDDISNTGGRIIHKGNGNFTLNLSNALQNTGTLASNGSLILSADSVDNSGLLQASNNVTLTSDLENNGTGLISAANISVGAGGATIHNKGKISATNSLGLHGSSVTNSNLLFSGNTANITAATIANSGTLSATSLTAGGFSNLTNTGRIESASGSYTGTQLTNNGSGVLIASGTSSNALNLNVSTLNNQGAIYNSGTNMSFGGTVNNSGQLIHAGTGTLVLGNNGSLNISGGNVSTAGIASLQGNISGNGNVYAKRSISIDASGTFTNTDSTLYTEGNLQINSAVNNQNGKLIADGSLGINTTGTVNNSSGVLQGNNVNINAGSLNNTGGTITSLGGGNGQIVASTINNSNGNIESSNNNFLVKTTSGTLTNSSGHITHNGSGTLTVNSSGAIAQNAGEINTTNTLILNAGSTLNNDGGNITAGQFDIDSTSWLSNVNGSITGSRSGNSTLNAHSINNSQGLISNNGSNLAIVALGALNNSNGTVASAGSGVLAINAGSISNSGNSFIVGNGAIALNGGTSLTNSGIISSATTLTVAATNITNSGTLASRNGAVNLNVASTLTNTHNISGKTALTVNATNLRNIGGLLQSDGNVTVDSNLQNVGNIKGRDLNITTRNALTIQVGDTLSASRNLAVNTHGNNITNRGNVTATGTASLTGNTLTNSGNIKSDGNGVLNFSNINNSGVLSSDASLTINSNIGSNSNTIAARNTLDINGNINNTNLVFAGSNLTIDGTITNSSTLYSGRDATLNGTITNNAGSISAVRNLSLTGNITNNRSADSVVILNEGTTNVTVEGGETPPRLSATYGSSTSHSIISNVRTTTSSTAYTASVSGSAGTIAAGGNLSLSGNITNNYSTISAGGNITLSGSSLTNNNAQNQIVSTITEEELIWSSYCDDYSTGLGGTRTCSRFTPYANNTTNLIGTRTETTFTAGGSHGTIAAGGAIIGNLAGQLTANNAGVTSLTNQSVNTNTSGSSGSASRGNSATGNNSQTVSVSGTNGVSQSTTGQGRNGQGVNGNANTNVAVAQQNQQQNVVGNNNQSSANIAVVDINANSDTSERTSTKAKVLGRTTSIAQQTTNLRGQQQQAHFTGTVSNQVTVNSGRANGSSDLTANGYTQSQLNSVAEVNTQTVAAQQNQATPSNRVVVSLANAVNNLDSTQLNHTANNVNDATPVNRGNGANSATIANTVNTVATVNQSNSTNPVNIVNGINTVNTVNHNNSAAPVAVANSLSVVAAVNHNNSAAPVAVANNVSTVNTVNHNNSTAPINIVNGVHAVNTVNYVNSANPVNTANGNNAVDTLNPTNSVNTKKPLKLVKTTSTVNSLDNHQTVNNYQQTNNQSAVAVSSTKTYSALTTQQQPSAQYSVGLTKGSAYNPVTIANGDIPSVSANDPRFTTGTHSEQVDNVSPFEAPNEETNVTLVNSSSLSFSSGSDTRLTQSQARNSDLAVLTPVSDELRNGENLANAQTQQLSEQGGNINAQRSAQQHPNGTTPLTVAQQTPEHSYQQNSQEIPTTNGSVSSTDANVDLISHNPDQILKTQIDNQNGLRKQHQTQNTIQALINQASQHADSLNSLAELEAAANAQAKNRQANTTNNGLAVSQNVFLTNEQVHILTQNLGLDENSLNQGQDALYAAVSHNDLLADGVTIGAGTYLDLRADGGINLDTGIGGQQGVMLRTENTLATGSGGFLDSDLMIGLALGGDFTNTLDLSAQNILLDINGNFTNNATVNAGSALSLSSTGNVINNSSLLSSGLLNLNAQGDITNNDTLSADIALNLTSGGNIINNSNLLSNGLLNLTAEGDILNQQSLISGRDVNLQAGGDIINRTEYTLNVQSSQHHRGSNLYMSTNVGKASEIISTNSLSLNAGNNIDLQGSKLNAASNISLNAGNNVLLGAIEKQNGFERHFKGGHNINYSTTYDVTELQAGGNLSVVAGNNLTSEGALFKASGDVSLAAGNEMNLLGVSEYHETSSKKTEKSTFKKTVKIDQVIDVKHQGTSILAGGNVNINGNQTQDGLSLFGSGDVLMVGTNIQAGGDVLAFTQGEMNVVSGEEWHQETHIKKKSMFGGLFGSSKTKEEDIQYLGHTEIQTGGDIILLAENDINVLASNLSGKNIIAHAGFGNEGGGSAGINILGDEQTKSLYQESRSHGLTLDFSDNFLSVAKETVRENETIQTEYVGSTFFAEENVSLTASRDVNVVGSDITAGGIIGIDAGRDVNLLAGQSTTSTTSKEEDIKTGIGVSGDDNGFSVFAGDESVEDTLVNTDTILEASTLTATNILINAGNDINQIASHTVATEDINMTAENNINIVSGIEYADLLQEQSFTRTGLTLTLDHNIGSTLDTLKNTGKGDDATSQASSILATVDAVSSTLSGPSAGAFLGTETQSTEYTAENQRQVGSTVSAGGNVNLNAGGDVSIAASQLNVVNDLNVDADNINIISLSDTVVEQTDSRTLRVGVGLSAGGDSVTIGGELSGSNAETAVTSNYGVGSQLNVGGNVNLTAEDNIVVQGSDLNSSNDINFTAGNDLILTHSINDLDSRSDSSHYNLGAGIGISSDGAVGVYAEAGYGENELERTRETINNTHVNAGGNVSINTGGDTSLTGAVINSDTLDAIIGGDLIVASVQDTGEVKGKQWDVSVTVSTGGGSGSVGYGETDGSTAWVTEQSGINTQNAMNIYVGNNTHVDGAYINSESDEMILDTGSLSYSNLEDHDNEESSYLSVGMGFSSEGDSANQTHTQNTNNANGTTGNINSVTGYKNSFDREQETNATIGQGTIIVRGNSNQDISDLNRDIEQAQVITKDSSRNTNLYVTSSSVDAVMNPTDTLERWGQQLENYDNNMALGLGNIINGIEGADNYLSSDGQGILNNENMQIAAQNVENSVLATTTALTVYSDDNGIQLAGLNSSWGERFDSIEQGLNAVDAVRDHTTGSDQAGDIVYDTNNLTAQNAEGAEATIQNVGDIVADSMDLFGNIDADIYYSNTGEEAYTGTVDGQQIVGINVENADITNGSEIVGNIIHEYTHIANESENSSTEALASVAGSVADSDWDISNTSEGRLTGQGVSQEDWLEANEDSRVLLEGTLNSIRAENVENNNACLFADICTTRDAVEDQVLTLWQSTTPEDQALATQLETVLSEYDSLQKEGALNTIEGVEQFISNVVEDGLIDTLVESVEGVYRSGEYVVENPEVIEHGIQSVKDDLTGKNGMAKQMLAIDNLSQTVTLASLALPSGGALVKTVKTVDVETPDLNGLLSEVPSIVNAGNVNNSVSNTNGIISGKVRQTHPDHPLTVDALPRDGDRVVSPQGGVPTCGQHSCTMLTNAEGKGLDPISLIRQTGQVATNRIDLENLLKRNGVDAKSFTNKSVDDLVKYTKNGAPVITRVTGNNGFSHWVVVDGITTRQGKKVVAIRDPHGQKYFTPVSTFQRNFSGDIVRSR